MIIVKFHRSKKGKDLHLLTPLDELVQRQIDGVFLALLFTKPHCLFYKSFVEFEVGCHVRMVAQ